MIISDTAVKNRTAVMVLALVILVAGIYSYFALPRESEPDISIPHVFISTTYRGVAPGDVETAVTIKIENKLKGLDGLKNLKSVSAEGESLIDVEFTTGVDIDEALRKVKDKVDEAKGELPTDLEDDPRVSEVNFSEMPIMIYSLSGTCGLTCLKEIGDDLEDEIEGVPGVLDVEITGGREREIQIEAIPEKLAYYGINITSLQGVVKGENSNTSGGAIHLGDGKFQLRVPGEVSTPEELYGLVVAVHKGQQPVYLKDVAKVVDGFKEESSRSRLNGLQAVNIVVKKRSGENIVAIAEAVNALLDKRQASWPKGTAITKVLDKSKDINNMVADLNNNILTGLILVVGVLFFTMGFRNAVIVSMAIPFSMLMTYTILLALGITLNMVVLFSLILALGMLVDNAIVIIENVFRFTEQGVGRVEAAMKATSEVAMPVIGSTLTTVVAFLPMMWWPGIMGEFMKYLPLTLIITLSASLFVALVINPAMAALFMKSTAKARRAARTKAADELAWEKPIEIKGAVLRPYAALLRFSLRHPIALVVGTALLMVLMVQGWLLVVGLRKPVEFFPNAEPKGIYVNVDFPEGADLNYIDKLLKRVEVAVAGSSEGDHAKALAPKQHRHADGRIFTGPSDLANISIIYTKAVSASTGSSAFEQNSPSHVGVRFVDLADRFESSNDTVEKIRQRVADIPGAKITVALEADGPPTGAPINIEIAGENFAVLGTMAKGIKKALAQIPHVKDVRDNFVEGTPSVRIRVDRQKAALFGVSTGAIGFALKAAYNGLPVSSFRDGNDDWDITVQLPEKDRQVTDVLRELMLTAPDGTAVPLSTLARVEITGSMGNITRINNQRVVTVKANVDENKIPAAVVRTQAEKMLAKMPLPPGYKVAFTGENQDQQESEAFLSKAFIIALLLIFLVIVAQFNSISQPFLIMTSVILATGGAFSGLMLYKMPFGIIMTGIGVISLAGVAVNNAIVLIDYTNLLRARGFSIKDAVIFAGATRLRPVFLTAITTILGLVPMITGVSYDFNKILTEIMVMGISYDFTKIFSKMNISWVSESSQFWQSMAVVVSFGLLIATFLTLVVVPTLYFLLERSKEGLAAGWMWMERKRAEAYRVLAGQRRRA